MRAGQGLTLLPKRVGPIIPVPTGEALLRLVMKAGDEMNESPDRDTYLARKEIFLFLLTIAEHDEYCVRVLVPTVQRILDEESALIQLLDRKGRVNQ